MSAIRHPHEFASDVPMLHGSAPAEAAASAVGSSQTSPALPAPTGVPAALSEEPRYIGVCRCNRYVSSAQISIKGKRVYLGCAKDPAVAARLYDREAHKLGRPLNFPSEHPVERAAPSGPIADAPLRKAVNNKGVQAGRDESRSARPAVISRESKAKQTPRHTPKPTASPYERSVSKNPGNARASSHAPVNKPLPLQRGPIDEVTRLLGGRPARPSISDRAAEEAQIAAFVAANKIEPLTAAGFARPGQEMALMAKLEAERLALIQKPQFRPGQPVTYEVRTGGRPYTRPGTVSSSPGIDPLRIRIDVVTSSGQVLTKAIMRSLVRARAKSTGEKSG